MLRFHHLQVSTIVLTLMCSREARAQPPALRSVVDAYAAAYQARDANLLMSLWDPESPQLETWRTNKTEFFAGQNSIDVERVSVREDSGAGDIRMIIFEMQVRLRPKVRMLYSGPMTVKLECILKAGQWKIRSATAPVEELASKLATAPASERDGILSEHAGAVTAELVQNLLERGVGAYDAGKLAQALEIDQLAHSIATRLGYKAGQADALRDTATILRAQGKPQEARKSFDQALAVAVAMTDNIRSAAALNGLAVVLNDLGETAKAFEFFNRSLTTSRAAADDPGIARALMNMASIQERRGEFEQAVQNSKEALAINEKLGNRRSAARILHNLGMFYGSHDDYEEGLEHYNRSLKLAQELSDSTLMAQNLLGMGSLSLFRGELRESFQYYERALAIANSLERPFLILQARGNLGMILEAQGNSASALEHIQAALALAERLGDKAAIATELNHLADIYEDVRNYEQAIEYYRRASEIAGQTEDNARVGIALHNIGSAYGKLKDHKRALEYYRRSLEIAQRLGKKSHMASTLTDMCEISSQAGSYDRALEMCSSAKAITEELENRDGLGWVLVATAKTYARQRRYLEAADHAENAGRILKSAGDQPGFLEASRIAGEAYLGLGKFDKARDSLQTAIDAVEDLRGQAAGSIEDRQRFLEDKTEAYLSMVAVLIHERDAAKALEYAERAKARSLVDILNAARVEPATVMSAEERSREQSLSKKVAALNRRVFQTPAADRTLPALRTDLNKARLELNAFHTNLYNGHSELRLRRGETPPATLQDVTTLLKDDKTAVLEYAVAQDSAWLFVVTGSLKPNLRTYPIRIKKDDLAHRIEQFRQALANRDFAYRDAARGLYDLLVAPAAAQLKGKTNLIVVPDGPIWELPMQALVSPSGSFLIQDAALSYAPSLTFLRDIRSRRRNTSATRELLAIGNPTLSGGAAGKVKAIYSSVELGPLPEAEREVTDLAHIYGQERSAIHLGSNAREDSWKRQAGNYRVLHLATHGIMDDANPLYSRLLLSSSPSNAGDDGFLEAWEVMQLNLKADLVVLSACESGRGRVGSGEGIIGLSWAFLVAGASTTVVSQWKVESVRSRDLMVAFHRHLHDSKSSPGEALRQAVLGLLKTQYNHPFYWAPFVAVGDVSGARR